MEEETRKEISRVKEVVPALIEPQAVQVAPCSRANTILNMAVVPPVLQKSLK